MPEIPVNPMDLPTETEPMDDTATYKGTISKVGGSAFDKNNHEYFGLSVEVVEPEEWKGRIVPDNYIPLPYAVDPQMDAKQRRRALESGIRLGRLCRSAKFNPGGRKWNTDELLGLEVSFTIRNEEYQGSLRPKVSDYLI